MLELKHPAVSIWLVFEAVGPDRSFRGRVWIEMGARKGGCRTFPHPRPPQGERPPAAQDLRTLHFFFYFSA